MAKKTGGANAMYKTDKVVSSREKVFNVIVFILLLLLAVVMVFPLIYMGTRKSFPRASSSTVS